MKKILMILYGYPPHQSIGTLRGIGFVKYLPKYGWQPIVITRDWKDEKYPLEEPEGIRVFRTEYNDILRFFRRGKRNTKRGENSFDQHITGIEIIKVRIKEKLSFLIKEFLAYPDEDIGWEKFAIQKAQEVIEKEKPDIIFSSSSPATSHIIASKLKKEFNIPWVADFRDLWTQNPCPYKSHTSLRKIFETRLEKNTLKNADVLITISKPASERLSLLHNKKVEVITNGFDIDNYENISTPLTKNFTITFTGQTYGARMDPTILFSAIRELVDEKVIDIGKFQVRFYGPEDIYLKCLIKLFHLENIVYHKGKVSFEESIKKQKESTVLLLLNWKPPLGKGTYTGKVFEYLSAQRPILSIPDNNGVIEELLRESNAGIVCGTKKEVKDILKQWYIYWKKYGSIPYKGKKEVIFQYTREKQTEKLSNILNTLVM